MRRGRDGDDERLTDVDMAAIVHETEKAVLFRAESDREVWLPKSRIEYMRGNGGWIVTMPEVLAIEKELV